MRCLFSSSTVSSMLSNLQLDSNGEVVSAEALMNIWVLEDHGVKVRESKSRNLVFKATESGLFYLFV